MIIASFFKFAWLKNAAPASDDAPNGKSINCKSGEDRVSFFLSDGIRNKPIASHPGCVHTPKQLCYIHDIFKLVVVLPVPLKKYL